MTIAEEAITTALDRQRGLSDLVAERKRIMNRCIRRMRRAEGKN